MALPLGSQVKNPIIEALFRFTAALVALPINALSGHRQAPKGVFPSQPIPSVTGFSTFRKLPVSSIAPEQGHEKGQLLGYLGTLFAHRNTSVTNQPLCAPNPDSDTPKLF